jgi:hypothetical protein
LQNNGKKTTDNRRRKMATTKKAMSKNSQPAAFDKSIKVSQSMINKIKADGVKVATTKAASGKASTPYIAGTIRMYGAKRVAAASKAPKKIAGVTGKGNAKKYVDPASLKDRYLPSLKDIKEFNNKANQANLKIAKDLGKAAYAYGKFTAIPAKTAIKVAKSVANKLVDSKGKKAPRK